MPILCIYACILAPCDGGISVENFISVNVEMLVVVQKYPY